MDGWVAWWIGGWTDDREMRWWMGVNSVSRKVLAGRHPALHAAVALQMKMGSTHGKQKQVVEHSLLGYVELSGSNLWFSS